MALPTLYFFRHGLATRSTSGYGDQIVTAELLPEGVPAVERMAKFLTTQPYDAGFRSEFIRCQQTASKITQLTGQGFVPDPRLNEFHLESFDVFTARVQAWCEWIQKQSYQHVWVCTHGAVIAAAKNLLTKGFYEPDDELDFPYTGEIWIVNNSNVERHDFNLGGVKG